MKTENQKNLSVQDFVKGVITNDRSILSRTITLVESDLPAHIEKANEVLHHLPRVKNSVRIGVTGIPGAGKSTFIDKLGTYLCQKGHKVAVLAVDPSSSITGGSILGDKTRMENLSRQENSFIRPSPSKGVLGGIDNNTGESIIICEAAGYDVILIETVGAGQSEAQVRELVDCFMLMTITGSGDELQNIKRGVIELADIIIINKADGDNIDRARSMIEGLNNTLQYLRSSTQGWSSKAFTFSSLSYNGLDKIWDQVIKLIEVTKDSGCFYSRRDEKSD